MSALLLRKLDISPYISPKARNIQDIRSYDLYAVVVRVLTACYHVSLLTHDPNYTDSSGEPKWGPLH